MPQAPRQRTYSGAARHGRTVKKERAFRTAAPIPEIWVQPVRMLCARNSRTQVRDEA